MAEAKALLEMLINAGNAEWSSVGRGDDTAFVDGEDDRACFTTRGLGFHREDLVGDQIDDLIKITTLIIFLLHCSR